LRRTYLGESDRDADVRRKGRARASGHADEQNSARDRADRRTLARHESSDHRTRSAKPTSAPHREDRARSVVKEKDTREARARVQSERSKRESRPSDSRPGPAKKPRTR
jgi:hypothetical protein